MKRLPTFGHQEFYVVTEVVAKGEDADWMTEYDSELVMLDNWDSWISDVQRHYTGDKKMPKFDKELRKLSNRDFEKLHVFDCPYDDDFSVIANEDCPECGHLIIKSDPEATDAKFCSNDKCNWCNDACLQVERDWDDMMRTPISRLYDTTIDPLEHCEKVGLLSSEGTLRDFSCLHCLITLADIKCFRTGDGWAGIEGTCPKCKTTCSRTTPITQAAMDSVGFL